VLAGNAAVSQPGPAAITSTPRQAADNFVAASDESARLMELIPLQYDDGPCLEAYRTGRPVTNVDLSAATGRWPEFAPKAFEAGFQSVHAFP
jgi:hypothetical protein